MSENEVKEETPANPPVPPAPTPEEMRAKFSAFQQEEWNGIANKERARMAKERGLLAILKKPADDAPQTDKDAYQKKYDSIIASIVLEGDSMRYAKDADGHPRLATDRNGFMAHPKGRGRRKPHMTKHGQTVKSTALQIFSGLFHQRMSFLEFEASQKGETFNGVPQAELTKLAAKATVLATQAVKENQRAKRRRLRNESKLQRRINRGVVPGNTNRRAYAIN